MSYFPGKSMFILGRNDMDVRELFQQANLEKLRTAKSSAEIRELTDKIDNHLIVVDELPNCVPAVRAQLFNLFDGYIELNGVKYDIGKGYSLGIATGNIGQKFTESSNELGRALKDRMHVTLDADYFKPSSSDTLDILAGDTNPRVSVREGQKDKAQEIMTKAEELARKPIPLEKLIIANYLLHGLEYCMAGGEVRSKTKMGDNWPNSVDNNNKGSDEALVLPVSVRAAKAIIRLSQSLDDVVKAKGASEVDPYESMLQAYKFVSAHSGVLNDVAVQEIYGGDRYSAMDAVITTTKVQLEEKSEAIGAGLEMAIEGKKEKDVFNHFNGYRWEFMKDMLSNLADRNKEKKEKKEGGN